MSVCILLLPLVGGPHDFIKVQNSEFFDYQAEQKFASLNDGYAQDVKEQINLLVRFIYGISFIKWLFRNGVTS